MDLWQNFTAEITEDGSPTLRLKQSSTAKFPTGESMHHSGGAATETLYIYGYAIQQVFERWPSKPYHFFVVGLGLGYIEMTVAMLAVIHKKSPEEVQIFSYESEAELRESFIGWLNAPTADLQSMASGGLAPPSMLHSVIYDKALALLIENYFSRTQILQASPTPQTIKAWLRESLQKNQLQLRKSLDVVPEDIQAHGILYDAFSSKTSPHLWQEGFLQELIQKCSASQAVLSTYACTGALKRALKYNEFQVVIRPGFYGKRECVFGERK